tara:strand:+ start:233 stop:511 length:279 start_codon:yes stop_codon:yes gene_type:complete
MRVKSIADLKKQVAISPEFEKDPKAFIEGLETSLPVPIFKVVVSIIGVVLLASIILVSIIIFKDGNEKVPDFFIYIGSTALGALVGLLAPNN